MGGGVGEIGRTGIYKVAHVLSRYKVSFQSQKDTYRLLGKLFGCVDINIECKNIPILVDMGGVGVGWLYWDIKNVFVLAYPQPLTESKIYQNRSWQFLSKTDQNYKNAR